MVGERPPSPPISNDGDFGLSAVQQNVADLKKHAPPRTIRPAPISISDPEIVSISTTAAPRDLTLFQDHYGDPSMYETPQNYTYLPVRGLHAVEVEGHANAVSADIRTDDPTTHPSYHRV
jgi:hypothetical protein